MCVEKTEREREREKKKNKKQRERQTDRRNEINVCHASNKLSLQLLWSSIESKQTEPTKPATDSKVIFLASCLQERTKNWVNTTKAFLLLEDHCPVVLWLLQEWISSFCENNIFTESKDETQCFLLDLTQLCHLTALSFAKLEPLILLILPIPNPRVYFYILLPQMAWLPLVLLLPYAVTGNQTHIGLIVLNYLEGPFSGGSTSRATLVKAPSLLYS